MRSCSGSIDSGVTPSAVATWSRMSEVAAAAAPAPAGFASLGRPAEERRSAAQAVTVGCAARRAKSTSRPRLRQVPASRIIRSESSPWAMRSCSGSIDSGVTPSAVATSSRMSEVAAAAAPAPPGFASLGRPAGERRSAAQAVTVGCAARRAKSTSRPRLRQVPASRIIRSESSPWAMRSCSGSIDSGVRPRASDTSATMSAAVTRSVVWEFVAISRRASRSSVTCLLSPGNPHLG